MHFALQCILAKNVDEKRLALRPTHLRFMEANKDRIFCGGPTVNSEGQLEMMLIILNASDLGSVLKLYGRIGNTRDAELSLSR